MRVIDTFEDGSELVELRSGNLAITVDDDDVAWLEMTPDEAAQMAHAILKWADRHE